MHSRIDTGYNSQVSQLRQGKPVNSNALFASVHMISHFSFQSKIILIVEKFFINDVW